MPDRNESKKIIIECDCGAHMLHVQSEIDYYEDDVINKTRFNQSFQLAMFRYGNQNRNFFARCVIAWKYLRTGNMFSDQLCLNPDEAARLAEFVIENIVDEE